MAARLASFNAPSTPNHSPARPHATNTPSKATAQESTIHRRVRALLTEFRVAAATWDDLVLHDGFRSAKALVDARTELDNALALLPQGTLPRERIVTPKIILMDAKAQEIGAVLIKMRKQFNKMISVVDNLDAVVTEAHKQKGWLWIHTEPLWQTWTLEKFALDIPAVLPYYDRALRQHTELAATLRDYSSSFEDSRTALAQWIAQAELQECPWEDYADMFEVEVDRWSAASK